MTVTDKPMSQIFEEAVEVLDRDGWCQYAVHDPITGRHCALGAIEVALGVDGFVATLLTASIRWPYAEYLEVHHLNGNATGWFNDQPGMTKEVVQETLMAAAKQLRDEGL